MRVSPRASAALRAGRPRSQGRYPYKPMKGEGICRSLFTLGFALRVVVSFAAAGRGLGARDTLTLALSHEGRGDLSLAIHAWFGIRTVVSFAARDAG